ncbi:unnamed protein product [Penicillium glandicola]
MSRAKVSFRAGMNPDAATIVWAALGIDIVTNAGDQQAVLTLIRQIYNPMLHETTQAGGDWRGVFRGSRVNDLKDKFAARQNELPALVRAHVPDPEEIAERAPAPVPAPAPAPVPAPAPAPVPAPGPSPGPAMVFDPMLGPILGPMPAPTPAPAPIPTPIPAKPKAKLRSPTKSIARIPTPDLVFDPILGPIPAPLPAPVPPASPLVGPPSQNASMTGIISAEHAAALANWLETPARSPSPRPTRGVLGRTVDFFTRKRARDDDEEEDLAPEEHFAPEEDVAPPPKKKATSAARSRQHDIEWSDLTTLSDTSSDRSERNIDADGDVQMGEFKPYKVKDKYFQPEIAPWAAQPFIEMNSTLAQQPDAEEQVNQWTANLVGDMGRTEEREEEEEQEF